MTPDLSASRIYTDFQGLSALKQSARDESPEALREVAQQFEAVFIKMMLKSMRDASLADGIFESDQSEMYLGMFDQQLALDLSSKQTFGIAEAMIRQLSGDASVPVTTQKPGASLANPASRADVSTSKTADTEKNVAAGTTSDTHAKQFDSPEEFAQAMLPLAMRAAKKLGVEPHVLVAQAALETGWGKKIIQREDGNSSHNLFGIKADKRWQGPSAVVGTLEFRDAGFKREQAAFRAYESFEQSFDDYVNFIRDEARYRNALKQTADAQQYIQALQQAGYATDPRYAEKVIQIMDRGVI